MSRMLKREVHLFLTALMFYTRIPCPASIDHSSEALNRSRRYFPLIGWIIGGISGGVFLLAQWVWPLETAVLLAIAAGILATGAFHEDGFADVSDAFGGGWGKQQILKIMKDSRIGAYGVIGVVLILGLKASLLIGLGKFSAWLAFCALLNAHTTSRFFASVVVDTHAYVRESEDSKAKPVASGRLGFGAWAFGTVTLLAPYLLFGSWSWAAAPAGLLAAGLSMVYLAGYFQKHIGGYTGDCLGSVQQLAEVAVYAALHALWTFI